MKQIFPYLLKTQAISLGVREGLLLLTFFFQSTQKYPDTHASGRSLVLSVLRTITFHFHALEKEMATHSSVLAWRIPETGEPGGLPSLGSHRVGHD